MRFGPLAVLLAIAPFALANTPPATPTILEPAADHQVVNAGDVHMVTSEMVDPDGDHHRCSDWEIRDNGEIVWSASCVAGALAVHIHLGDGSFTGALTGKHDLSPSAQYLLRVRHRDDSDDPATEWSGWAERPFDTAPEQLAAPMMLEDVLAQPAVRWSDDGQAEIVPVAGASVSIAATDGEPLVTLDSDGIHDRAARREASAVRVIVQAGIQGMEVAESTLTFRDQDGTDRSIYLPALSLEPNAGANFWISANGGSHDAHAEDRAPSFEQIARGAPVPWSVEERGFAVDRFATGFALPVNIAFVPSPSSAPDAPLFYVTELYGTIKVVYNDGSVHDYATEVLNFDPTGPVPGGGELGLTGIVVDPATGDVLVSEVYLPDGSVDELNPRVLRYHSEDGGRTAANHWVVVEFPGELEEPSHQISNLSFGPDGKLYLHVGDSQFFWIAQWMTTVRGKILRLNPDGTAPEDNPFYDASDGITAADYIFALGFRNPFGGAWRAADQSLYEVENGPATDRLAKVVAGRNYLWDGSEESMHSFAVINWEPPVAPVQLAFVQPELFNGSGFPEEQFDSAFITESGATWALGPQVYGKKIEKVRMTPSGELAAGPTPFLVYDGTGRGTAAGIAAGPDGLYFTDLYKDFGYETPVDRGANVFRVRWVGYAAFTMRSLTTRTIAFTDESNVPDASSWRWDFGDGETSTSRHPVHRFGNPGSHLIRLEVTGSRGTVVTTQRVFLADSFAPVSTAFYTDDSFTRLIAVGESRTLDFDWGDGSPGVRIPADGFGARFTTQVIPQFSERYRFTVREEGKVRLSVGGQMLVDAWQAGDSEHSGEIDLAAGVPYEVMVDFADAGGPAAVQVLWESASQPQHPVPETSEPGRRRPAGGQ